MTGSGWTTPADVRSRLLRRWQRGDILASTIRQDGLFPLRLPIRGPNSAQITADFSKVRDWTATWREQTLFSVEWRSFSHRIFGENQMPSAVVIADARLATKIIHMQRELDTFLQMTAACREVFPELLDWLARRCMTALTLAKDWSAILAATAWVRDHPRSGVFLRQLDAPGVHTKLVETHRGIISELLERVLPADGWDASSRGAEGFARRYGFRDKPERIRVRFLDTASAIAPERLGLDVTMNASAFASLDPDVGRVFITENEINFLAFPDCARSLVVFGAGYGWSALANAAWLRTREIFYWGDLDTHGFAILNQLRHALPHTQSMLMTREILLRHRALWTTESSPRRVVLPLLTREERACWEALGTQGDASAPRLEQERIPFSVVVEELQRIVSAPSPGGTLSFH